MPESIKIVFDLDDFHVDSVGMEYLLRLKEHFPKFRCTLFTIPLPIEQFGGGFPKDERIAQWAKMINGYDWIEIAPHGLFHVKGECAVSRQDAALRIRTIESIFKRFGLKYVKIFKAPHWIMSRGMYQELIKRGYNVAIDIRQKNVEIYDYQYDWSIDGRFPYGKDIVKAHGHINTMDNAIIRCFEKLLKEIPPDADWLTVSEYINLYGKRRNLSQWDRLKILSVDTARTVLAKTRAYGRFRKS